MADNGNPYGTDLRGAQDAIRAMMTPSTEDNVEVADAPVEVEGFDDTEVEEAVEVEAAEEPDAVDYFEEDDGDEPPENRTYRVKVNGEDIEVSEDELLNGYSRQQDYTRKAQELAESRKSVEAMDNELAAERQQYEQLLPALHQQLQQLTANEPNWDKLYEENPTEAIKLERQWKRLQSERHQQLEAVQQEQQRLATINQRRLQEETQRQLAAEQSRLPDLIPAWKDQSVAQKEATEIREFLLGQGFSGPDVDGIQSAQLIAMARAAMLYNRGETNVNKAKAARKSGPKTMKPGSRGTQPQRRGAQQKAQQRLAKSGRVQDAAAVIKGLL